MWLFFLAKTDIKSAYKIVPIHPDEQYLLGFTLNSKFYYDRTLPMGLRSSCQIFESISDALKWIATEKFGISPIVKVLDDFMFFAATKETCDRYLRGFSIMCENLGVPLAPEKTEGPNTVLKFLGIELDTCQMEARLPFEKVQKCRLLVKNALAHTKLREIQQLLGFPNFTCQVVIPGRCFCAGCIILL